MRRFAVVGVAVFIGVLVFAPGGLAASGRVAALQVGLRAHGFDPGPIDGVRGALTTKALLSFQRARGIKPTGKVGRATRRALGARGRPLLGQRELGVGAVGWDVAVLEFRLRRYGLGARAVDGRFTRPTAVALRRYQLRRGLAPDGIAGPKTYRTLAGRTATRAPMRWHVVQPGESFFSIAARYHVSPWRLAQRNRLSLMNVIVPNQRLALPKGARLRASPAAGPPASRDSVRAAIDYWSRVYGVDPALARALAWMESGFQQDVVSSVGAIGVMQLLPETWEFVDLVLLGVRTPRTYQGNVRAGVRYLRWQLDEFDGNVRLALAGWYQGARAVRERGLYDDTKEFVRIVRALYGTV
ncbi:MAG TPA: peptidoglycan-binding protein [Gaiellaceae bacterium]|nr:peptidoglycan-binding protein [Gaiellaceae bacterium]